MARAVPFGARSTADQVLAGIDLSGKRILVTGCGSGLGLETMNALAANGAHVIGMDRTFELAANGCKKVAYLTEPMACDLSDFASIATAAEQLRAAPAPIDVIVANAAVANLPALNTRYGVEMQFLVNHVGHFALITRLLDLLRDGSGRVVIMSGGASTSGGERVSIMFDNLAGQRFYKPAEFYAQSKLANALFAKELARRLRGRGIAVNAVHPGATRGTRINRHLGGLRRLWRTLAGPFAKSTSQGAATAALLAGSPSVNGVSGEIWQDCKVARGSRASEDADLAAALWRVSESLVASPPLEERRIAVAGRAALAAA